MLVLRSKQQGFLHRKFTFVEEIKTVDIAFIKDNHKVLEHVSRVIIKFNILNIILYIFLFPCKVFYFELIEIIGLALIIFDFTRN